MKYYQIEKIYSVRCCRACKFSSNSNYEGIFYCHVNEDGTEFSKCDGSYWWIPTEDACHMFKKRR